MLPHDQRPPMERAHLGPRGHAHPKARVASLEALYNIMCVTMLTFGSRYEKTSVRMAFVSVAFGYTTHKNGLQLVFFLIILIVF